MAMNGHFRTLTTAVLISGTTQAFVTVFLSVCRGSITMNVKSDEIKGAQSAWEAIICV